MTKAELARRMAWRFKVIQQAAERSRNIALRRDQCRSDEFAPSSFQRLANQRAVPSQRPLEVESAECARTK
jgi:hypothetical protein